MEKLSILHIANDYSGSKVYKNLVKGLDQLGLVQYVYTAIRSESLEGKNAILFQEAQSKIHYRNILKKSDRIFYTHKINKITKDVEEEVLLSEINLIHAHTWYSDGGVAYELYKKHNIPYVITVRNTDLNLFYKYAYHLRKFGREIIENANKVFFISPSYHKRFFKLKPFINNESIINKSEVIPNGIDDFWINNYKSPKQKLQDVPVLLFIGKFAKGKNVLRLIEAVNTLNKTGTPCELNLVGGGGNEEKEVLTKVEQSEYINFHGKIFDKRLLQKQFESADIFVMPSHKETFGLVYIEAISQGLPVIYTQNEGIDGFYKEVGLAVNPNQKISVVNAIKEVIENYNPLQDLKTSIITNHDWLNIARTYKNIYQNC